MTLSLWWKYWLFRTGFILPRSSCRSYLAKLSSCFLITTLSSSFWISFDSFEFEFRVLAGFWRGGRRRTICWYCLTLDLSPICPNLCISYTLELLNPFICKKEVFPNRHTRIHLPETWETKLCCSKDASLRVPFKLSVRERVDRAEKLLIEVIEFWMF